LNKPLYLDQSIAHPVEKEKIFSQLRIRYPEWMDDIPAKRSDFIESELSEHRLSARIVVASTFTKNSLLAQGVKSEKIVINHYGVSNDFFRPRSRRKSSNKVRFIYLGTLGARKGLPLLLEAWMKGELYQRAELWLAGPGSPSAIKMAEQVPGVSYKGKLPFTEMPSLLDSCDCLIFPSFFEGFGQVILEAMACGLPVITTEATAGPDVIEEGKEGFIFNAGDETRLSALLKIISGDHRLCFEMGLKAQEKAKQFSWESYGDRWKVILDNDNSYRL
jgi:starch synthase